MRVRRAFIATALLTGIVALAATTSDLRRLPVATYAILAVCSFAFFLNTNR